MAGSESRRLTEAAAEARGYGMSRMDRARHRGDAGFTFVEVLTVIIILAILSLIAITTFLGQRDKAERSRAISSLRNAETFAVAIRSDSEHYSECIEDYKREAGASAPYLWIADADGYPTLGGASSDANAISVYGPRASSCDDDEPTDGWVTMAAQAKSDCFYQAIVPGSQSRILHRAEVQTSSDPTCEGSELQVASVDPITLEFRNAALVEPSGW